MLTILTLILRGFSHLLLEIIAAFLTLGHTPFLYVRSNSLSITLHSFKSGLYITILWVTGNA